MIQSPISKRKIKQAGALFVDDTNLMSGLEEDSDLVEVAAKAQNGVNTWGKSLIATGGVLNPAKCSFTIHDMWWTPKGSGNTRTKSQKQTS